jgi:hypothetical protein
MLSARRSRVLIRSVGDLLLEDLMPRTMSKGLIIASG